MRSATELQRRTATRLEQAAVEAASTFQVLLRVSASGHAEAPDHTRQMLLQLLTELQLVRDEADAAIDRVAGQARTANLSWDSIGEALGISRQAAHARFHGPRVTAEGETPTRTRQPRRAPRGAQK